MNMGNALGLYKVLFCVAMAFGILWMCTGQYDLYNRGRTGWVHTLNRFFFWGVVVFLVLALFCIFQLV